MKCRTLAERVQSLNPAANDREVARTCLLMANSVDSLNDLNQDQLAAAWREVSLRLQLATDQHAAVTQELDDLAQSDPTEFSKDQVWVLLRAIKVQSQVLELYLGEPALDV